MRTSCSARSQSEFIHHQEATRVEGILERMGKGDLEQARSTHRVRHALGHWVWVEALFRLVRAPETGAAAEIVSSLRDISIRQALQDQVQAGADLLQATLESMEQGLDRRVGRSHHQDQQPARRRSPGEARGHRFSSVVGRRDPIVGPRWLRLAVRPCRVDERRPRRVSDSRWTLRRDPAHRHAGRGSPADPQRHHPSEARRNGGPGGQSPADDGRRGRACRALARGS